MDTKIENGDMVLDSTGAPVYIDGTEELWQRAMFCITAKKGGFMYNKAMGSEAVTSVLTERDRKNLEARLKEAVVDITGLEVCLSSAEELVDGTIKAEVTFLSDGEEINQEVFFDGEL